MNKRILSILLAIAFVPLARGQTTVSVPVLTLSTTAGVTTFGQVNLTLSTGQYVSLDGSGNPVAVTPTVYAPLGRAGNATMTVAGGLTKTITFSSPLTNTSYALNLTPQSGISATNVQYSNKTINGFTINVSIAVAGVIDWTATPNQ